MTASKPSRKTFSDDFLWGATTSTHQTEGSVQTQWAQQEKDVAIKLARLASKKKIWPSEKDPSQLPNWEYIKHQATDPKNYISGDGIEHYTQFRKDLDIAQSLNLNSFRFTIEWARIEPREGEWSQEAINHYKTYIDELKKRHIEPFPTLWHWTVPVWFAEKGGFEERDNIRYFERFIRKIHRELLEDVRYITTLDEPNVYAFSAYMTSDYPADKKGWLTGLKVYRNLKETHRRVYRILKRNHPKAQVGYSLALMYIQAKRPYNYIDKVSAWFLRYGWNWWFLGRTRREMDFVGVGYRYAWYVRAMKLKTPPKPLSDTGLFMKPEGLYSLLVEIHARYQKPIIVTENSIADARDKHRHWWLEETMTTLQRALNNGIKIKGYHYGNLLDEFEWTAGWWARTGLVEVDRKNLKRTIRPSAHWFKNWIIQKYGK